MKKSGFLLLFLIFSINMFSQNIISGTITDKSDKKPIAGVVVTLTDAAGETITYDISKSDGGFSLKVKSNEGKLTLTTRLMGYDEVKRSLDNKTQNLNIQMSMGDFKLREVVVKSKPIWNKEDTIVYSVNAFKTLGDKSIGDVLKKLPGVEVSASGSVKYQGEAINKFYIEGLDLLEKRYGIATNNVPADAIHNVEIIENHQPIKTLNAEVFSDKAAINLKLKKDKMSRPTGTATIGAGYADDMLWLAEIFGMSMARKQQSIVMYKGNNSAKDIASELTSQEMSISDLEDASGFSRKSLLNPASFSYPPIEKKRYLFNRSHTLSANNLWKTGENSQFRINAQYLHDVLQENIERKSQYFLSDSTLHITETSHTVQRSNITDIALTYTDNNKRYYLNNSLVLDGVWNKTESSVIMNELGVKQQFNIPEHTLKNNLQYIRRSGKNLWDFTSYIVYSSQPQNLRINIDTIPSAQNQQVNLSQFYTRNSTYYSYGWQNSSLMLKGAVEASLSGYSSSLQHPVFKDTISSDINSHYLLLELIPTYIYKKDKLNINAEVNLRQYNVTIAPTQGIGNSEHFSSFLPNPSLKINYKATPMLTLNASYRYMKSLGDFLDFTDTYFMSSYRNFHKRSGILSQSTQHSFRFDVRYRNPLTTFFFNTSAGYMPSERNTVISQRFIGKEVVATYRNAYTHSQNFLWNAYIGKYLSGIRTNISLNVNYNRMAGERYQQDILFPFVFSGWSFFPKANIKFSDNCSVAYQLITNKAITEITLKNGTNKNSLWQTVQQLSGYYLIGKNWQLDARLEHTYNKLGNNNSVKIFFADLDLSYRNNQIEVTLSANNLFNKKSYAYSIYNGIDKFDYSYQLRPRMLMMSLSYKY